MHFTGLVYRAHDPTWAWDPLSGEGARREGGRFNKRGIPALYTSLSVEGAWIESTPFGIDLQPRTLCAYRADIEPIFDATDAQEIASKGISLADLDNPYWKQIALRGETPSTQRLADRLIAEGFAGMLARSYARSATASIVNLVLWRWGPDLPHQLKLIDDEDVLESLRKNV